MKSIYIVFYFINYCIGSSLSYNILAIAAHPCRSHHTVTSAVISTLANRGHNVTFYSKVPIKSPPRLPNYNFIDISECNLKKIPINANSNRAIGSRISALRNPYQSIFTLASNAVLNETAVEECLPLMELWHAGRSQKYDLLITEAYAMDAMLMFSYQLHVPSALISSTGLLPWISEGVANPVNPSYIPHLMSPGFWGPLTFVERVQNTMLYLVSILTYNKVTVKHESKTIQRFLGLDGPSLTDMVKNVSLILVNTHDSLHQATPKVPSVMSIAGIHVKSAKPLPKDIEKFMNESTHGVVYFCMGSILRGDTFSEEMRDVFLHAFSKLPQRVLWKWDGDYLPGKSDNIMISKWMPQRDILAHPNLKLFISHGGLLGTSEAVYEGVPMLGIPVFGDQRTNLRGIEANGAGEILDYNEISEAVLAEKLSRLLQNPQYKKNAVELSNRYKDRPMSAEDTAVYWIEYVIRHKGAAHLKTAAVHMPRYQYFLLDVIAFMSFIIVCVLVIFYYSTKFTLRFIYRIISDKALESKDEITKKVN